MQQLTNRERKAASKRHYHSSQKKKASSSTPGSSKGIRPSALQRGTCRRNRSYQKPGYAAVMASLGKKGKSGNAKG